MSAPAVLLDACTLVPIRLASCLLALAEAGLLAPLWSDEILDEVERNLPKLKAMTPQKAKQRIGAMRDAFDDEACVDGYEDLVPQLTCDEKDRHVLAAAIAGGAGILLTFNLKDFPLLPHGPMGSASSIPMRSWRPSWPSIVNRCQMRCDWTPRTTANLSPRCLSILQP